MHLHRHSENRLVSQLETLLMLVGSHLDSVAATNPQDGYAAFACRVAHLRNACELVAAWAGGADVALSELLPRLAVHEASGVIAESVMADLCAPLIDNLGECYVYSAMSLPQE